MYTGQQMMPHSGMPSHIDQDRQMPYPILLEARQMAPIKF
jgi:hypothetical protein